MREAYLIRHDDLMAIQNRVQDLCDQLIMAAEDCRQMIGRFRENGRISRRTICMCFLRLQF